MWLVRILDIIETIQVWVTRIVRLTIDWFTRKQDSPWLYNFGFSWISGSHLHHLWLYGSCNCRGIFLIIKVRCCVPFPGHSQMCPRLPPASLLHNFIGNLKQHCNFRWDPNMYIPCMLARISSLINAKCNANKALNYLRYFNPLALH